MSLICITISLLTRYMHRSQPIANKICFKKWDDYNHELHKQRLDEIRMKQSKTNKLQTKNEKLMDECNKLRNNNRKKMVIKEVANTEINRENHALLEKMSKIMRSTYRSTLSLFAWLKPLTTILIYKGASTSPTPPLRLRSLNREARKQEIVKITMENQEIMKRIRSRNANYSAKEWEKHGKMSEYYLRNICEYPLQLSQHDSSMHTSRISNIVYLFKSKPSLWVLYFLIIEDQINQRSYWLCCEFASN